MMTMSVCGFRYTFYWNNDNWSLYFFHADWTRKIGKLNLLFIVLFYWNNFCWWNSWVPLLHTTGSLPLPYTIFTYITITTLQFYLRNIHIYCTKILLVNFSFSNKVNMRWQFLKKFCAASRILPPLPNNLFLW